MPLPAMVGFGGLFLAVIILAWESRARWLKDRLRAIGLASTNPFYLALWASTLGVFWWLFRDATNMVELGLILLEAAGITSLAVEVRTAQEREALGHTLPRLAALAPLVGQGKEREYFLEYFAIDRGMTGEAARAEADRLEAEKKLALEVRLLASATDRQFQRFEEDSAPAAIRYRKHRLLRGVALLLLATLGHGLGAFSHVAEADPVTPIPDERLDAIQAQLAQIHRRLEADSLAIDALRQENRLWHRRAMRQPPSPIPDHCRCPPTD